MPEPNPKRQLLLLERLWTRWTKAVAQCLRRRSLHGISPAQYRILHSHLVRELEKSRAVVSAGGQLQHLSDCCRPWVSLEVLQSTDRRILSGLVEQSRKLGFEAFGKRALRRGVAHAATWLAAGSVATIFFAGIVGKSGAIRGEATLQTMFRRELFHLWRTLEQVSPREWLVVAVAFMLVTGIWMTYTPKRY